MAASSARKSSLICTGLSVATCSLISRCFCCRHSTPRSPEPAIATTRDEAQTGKNENRFEQEQDAFHRRVWEKYREIAKREPERVVLIAGDLSIDEIHEQIAEAVAERLLLAGRNE